MRVMTPFEEFVDRLRLDVKTQLPLVEARMNAGAKGAAPMASEMLQVRQQLLNLELSNNTADKPQALASYHAVAARMAATEAAAFAEVYAVLRPNQHSRAPAAFDRMGGFFIPVTSAGRAGRGASGGALGRLEILTTLFTLTGDQKRDIKTWFDAAYKALADTRKGLAGTRATLVAAIQAGKPQDEITAAAEAYAVHVTAMTDAEMTALARLLRRLEPEQRANQAAISTAFGLVRGFFVNASKWDIIPDGRGY